MINKVEYELEYRIKGEKFIKKIIIDFVPNQRHEDYAILNSEIIDVQSKWNNVRLLEDEIKSLIEQKPDGFMESIKELRTEAEKLLKDLSTLKSAKILERRFDLLRTILIDNGYKDDSELMSWEFWNNNVDPKHINELLTQSIYKDIDKKKVVH